MLTPWNQLKQLTKYCLGLLHTDLKMKNNTISKFKHFLYVFVVLKIYELNMILSKHSYYDRLNSNTVLVFLADLILNTTKIM